MNFLYSAGAFVLAVSLLITIHEFGHFWVARKLDVKILRFSVGFGRPVWLRRFGKDRTEFVIAVLPLGGYVKMLDEREGEVAPEEYHRTFNRKALVSRTAIVLAGPLFNFLFAIVVYWLMFSIGITGIKPVIGEVIPSSIAEQAGFRPGYEIVAVDLRPTPTWAAVLAAMVAKVIDSDEIVITVRDKSQSERQLVLNLAGLSLDNVAKGGLFEMLGVRPFRPRLPAVIGQVHSGGAGAIAGLEAGDRILSADGTPMEFWDAWVEYVQAHPEETMHVEVLRGNERVMLTLRPEAIETEHGRIGRIGASVYQSADLDRSLAAVERYPPLSAFGKSLQKTWEMSVLTLRILFKILFGQASVANLSGPISIAQYAGISASIGVAAFLGFLGVVSISLGVLNLLPIPLLDGGHLMYYLIEFAKGSPVSESAQLVGQQIGVAVLLGLMALAFYNDITRLLG
ncbi:MAG: RIP metalloprotease RseP [Gammaproteobacteria bacterium]|nr:RIP metalloprotease RseP [Gammaproteobacteria bacterium]